MKVHADNVRAIFYADDDLSDVFEAVARDLRRGRFGRPDSIGVQIDDETGRCFVELRFYQGQYERLGEGDE